MHPKRSHFYSYLITCTQKDHTSVPTSSQPKVSEGAQKWSDFLKMYEQLACPVPAQYEAKNSTWSTSNVCQLYCNKCNVTSFFSLFLFIIADNISILMYIVLCLFSALSRRVDALQISIIIIINVMPPVQTYNSKFWIRNTTGWVCASQAHHHCTCLPTKSSDISISIILIIIEQCEGGWVHVCVCDCVCVWLCVCERDKFLYLWYRQTPYGFILCFSNRFQMSIKC